MQAAPTQALMAHQAFKEKKAKLAGKKQDSVLEKYGNAAPDKPDADLLLPASESYVEYDRTCEPLVPAVCTAMELRPLIRPRPCSPFLALCILPKLGEAMLSRRMKTPMGHHAVCEGISPSVPGDQAGLPIQQLPPIAAQLAHR